MGAERDRRTGPREPSTAEVELARTVGKKSRAERARPQVTTGDVAAAAIDGKDAGKPVTDGVRAPMEAQLGVDLSGVRVHDDAGAQAASQAMGARAFAHGGDVFMGPGESTSDLSLMGHELTHVAQQGAAAPATQRQVEVGAANSPAEREADAVAQRAVEGRLPADAPRIVEDGVAPQPGQMNRSAFMTLLREQVTSAASDALGPAWSVVGCPYIEQWFQRHASTDAAQLDRMARRYSGLLTPRTAADYLPPILARLRAGIARWRAGDDVSGDLASAGLSSAAAAAGGADSDAARPGAAGVQQKPTPRDGGDPVDRLGDGAPLDSGTASRMGEAFGESFGDVVVHTGSEAAQLAADEDASALTVGNHIAFGAGEYAPGQPQGDALLAHELAHVVQQKDATPASDGGEVERGAAGSAHEQDADRAATGVMARLFGGVKSAAGRVGPALTSGYKLQRCPRNETTTSAAPPIPTTHGADQRTGAAAVPDADQQRRVAALLDPNAYVPAPAPSPPVGGGPAPAPAPPVRVEWDGLTSNPDHAANRAALQTGLTNALTSFLAGEQARVQAMKALPRIAMTQAGTGAMAGQDVGVQGIANAASSALESTYGESMNAAVRTQAQLDERNAPMSATPGAGQNIFDPYSKADRKRMLGGISDDQLAFGVGYWAIKHDAGCTTHTQAHHFSPAWQSGQDDWNFLETLVNNFMGQGTNKQQMIDYRLYIWNEHAPQGITLLTAHDPADHGGDANKSEKAKRWSIFTTAIHETLHARTHPAFETAEQGRGSMGEGFPEMYAKDASDPILTRVRSGGDEPLRRQVEGAADPIDASVIPSTYTVAGKYKPDYDQAIAVRNEVGDAACRAAFFQGHVELLGLAPDGSQLSGTRAAGSTATIRKPAGVANLAALATATGLTVAEIRAANSGITDALPADLVLPGCREHIVVGTSDSTGASAVESRAQIAAQHGVSEADLVRANPGITVDSSTNEWPTLSVGQRILVPKH